MIWCLQNMLMRHHQNTTHEKSLNNLDMILIAEIPILESFKNNKKYTIDYGPCTMSYVETAKKIHSPKLEMFYPAPLKQIKSGLFLDEIKCKEHLELILRHDGITPTCIKPESIPKLVERGWINKTIVSDIQEEDHIVLITVSNNEILSLGVGFDLPEDDFTREDLEQLEKREKELRKIRDDPNTLYEQRQLLSSEISKMQDRLQYPFQTGVPYPLVKEIKERYAVLEMNLDDAKKHVRFSVLNSNAISSEHHALRVGIHPQSFGISELEFQDKKIREYLGSEMNILYEAASVMPN